MPTYSTTPAYCTDEDIAVYSPGDVAILTPEAATLASGSDGVFAEDTPWVLTSESVDFEAQGVAAGMLVVLKGGTSGASQLIRGSGANFAVSAVAGGSLTLRRIGFADGVGQAPGPPAGATAVDFRVCSLAPQIAQASDQLNRLYGIDAASLCHTPDDLRDLKDLELATVLTVLINQYGMGTRTGDGDFAAKLKTLETRLAAVMSRVQVRWKPATCCIPPAGPSRVRILRG
jgi:hypothetical protein